MVNKSSRHLLKGYSLLGRKPKKHFRSEGLDSWGGFVIMVTNKGPLADLGGRSTPSNAQIIMGCVALGFIFALPSLSSTYNENASNLQSAVEPSRTVWDFKIIADLDTQSKVADSHKPSFYSILVDGVLMKDPSTGAFSVQWGTEHKLTSGHNEAGRGMELSELIKYKGGLYTVDDRTGLVFEVTKEPKVVPRYIIMEGNGLTDKGMKLEWATVKDDVLYLGSFGKEFTAPDGTIVNTNNLWVTTVDEEGHMQRYDWTDKYEKIRKALGAERPGYVIHEAASWSPAKRQWVFLPRRVSSLPYDEELDEKMGSNKIVIADEFFNKLQVREATKITPERGFSTFKFLPGTNDDVILALKSMEEASTGTQASYLTLFTLKGEVLLEETAVPGAHKFEGLEFA